MAADGSFSTKPMGFDKNEVMEYISNVRKRMNEMEQEKKENDAKTAEALKTAAAADERVAAAVKEGEDKAKALQEKVDIANVKAERLSKQVDDLKKQLEEEKRKMTDMLKSGKGVSAEAQKAYAEVLAKAETDAKEITDKAKETAEKIVADAESRRADADAKLSSFMDTLRGTIETFNAGYKTVGDSAAELLGAQVPAAAIEIPDFAAMAKAAAPAPAPEIKAEEAPEPEKPEKTEKQVEQEKRDSAKPAAEETKPEPKAEEKAEDDLMASFDEEWGGSEIAQTIANEAKTKQEVPLVNPNAANDLFGADLFGSLESTDSAEDMLSVFGSDDSKDSGVGEVLPMDNSDHAKAVPDSNFASDLIAQTMTSANLDDNADEDLLAAVKAQEEKFAVQPNISMDELDMDDNAGAPSDEDDLMKALREAEAAFGDLSGLGEPVADAAADSLGGDNPWDDLQKELAAMESAGGLGTDFGIGEPEKPAEPAAPSADDASIWNFGNTDSSSDDDMSGDMFGGFGGF